jgi:hypothetical protein
LGVKLKICSVLCIRKRKEWYLYAPVVDVISNEKTIVVAKDEAKL